MKERIIISVPVTDEQKSWLEDRADENGRATGREAQAIIEAAKKRDERKAR